MAKEDPPVHMKCLVANNALLEAPVYENRSRASNFMAVIDVDATMPGGLSRRWMGRGRGECLYQIEQLALFDAVEFGGDYTTSYGTKHRDRWYGIVVAITDGYILLEQSKTGARAVLRSKEARTSTADRVKALKVEQASLVSRVAKLEHEIAELEQPSAEKQEDAADTTP